MKGKQMPVCCVYGFGLSLNFISPQIQRLLLRFLLLLSRKPRKRIPLKLAVLLHTIGPHLQPQFPMDMSTGTSRPYLPQ